MDAGTLLDADAASAFFITPSYAAFRRCYAMPPADAAAAR